MHTAEQIHIESFAVEIDGEPSDLDGLFPERHPYDRFGIVVTEPLGTDGASLLIQASMAHWFDIRPERRYVQPSYPEVYAFHLGGPFGDHSGYDFWPPRKEVFIADHDPVALLTEINARGITRLALPDGPLGDPSRLTWGPSTWAEQASARDWLISCYAYSADGDVAGADVRITTTDERLEENPLWTLDLVAVTDDLEATKAASGFEGFLPGLSVAVDNYRWIDAVRLRSREVAPELRAALTERRAAQRSANGTVRTETFRRVDVDTSLLMLAALG